MCILEKRAALSADTPEFPFSCVCLSCSAWGCCFSVVFFNPISHSTYLIPCPSHGSDESGLQQVGHHSTTLSTQSAGLRRRCCLFCKATFTHASSTPSFSKGSTTKPTQIQLHNYNKVLQNSNDHNTRSPKNVSISLKITLEISPSLHIYV